MSAARRLETNDRFCCKAMSTQRSSLTGSGLAGSKRLDGPGEKIGGVAGDLAQQIDGRGERAPAAITVATPLSCAARASSTSVTAIKPDLVAGLGLLELALNGVQRHLLRFEIILRGQHIEVALRHALDQVLLGGLIVRFGLGDLRIGAAAKPPSSPTETGSA